MTPEIQRRFLADVLLGQFDELIGDAVGDIIMGGIGDQLIGEDIMAPLRFVRGSENYGIVKPFGQLLCPFKECSLSVHKGSPIADVGVEGPLICGQHDQPGLVSHFDKVALKLASFYQDASKSTSHGVHEVFEKRIIYFQIDHFTFILKGGGKGQQVRLPVKEMAAYANHRFSTPNPVRHQMVVYEGHPFGQFFFGDGDKLDGLSNGIGKVAVKLPFDFGSFLRGFFWKGIAQVFIDNFPPISDHKAG